MNEVAAVPLGDLMATKAGSIDPSKFPTEPFDLYSIPAFDRGEPDVAVGSSIGSSKQIVKPGDVLLSRIVPHIRRSCVVGSDRGRRIIASGEWIVFRSDKFDSGYLRHVLVGDPFHAQFMNTVAGVGGSLLRARPIHVANITIPLPPLPEQRRIAAILDKADALRAKRQEALARSLAFDESLYASMFGEASRDSGSRSVPLGELIKLKSGGFLPASSMSIGGVHPVFGGNGINGYHDAFLFEDPKIVIGRVGAYCGAVHVAPPRSWITDNALYVAWHRDDLSFTYLAYALKRANLNQFASQSGQPLISGSRIYPVRILVPPISDQLLFGQRLETAEELRSREVRSLQVLDDLFASLQQRAFHGGL